MTDEEAIKVIKILNGADGGCGVCITSLVHDFMEQFPMYTVEFIAPHLIIDIKQVLPEELLKQRFNEVR